MKRKSPKNHRRAQRASATGNWRTIMLGNLTNIDDSDCIIYYNTPNTTTVTWPIGSGFVTGDLLTIAGAASPKRSKKVHVARRRIPKRGNNGEYIITDVGSNAITVKGINELATVTKISESEWTVEGSGCVE